MIALKLLWLRLLAYYHDEKQDSAADDMDHHDYRSQTAWARWRHHGKRRIEIQQQIRNLETKQEFHA